MALNVRAFAMASGLVWGLGLFVLGLIATLTGYWVGAVNLIGGNFYFGYAPTFKGSLLGLVWGFFDAAICGAVFAWLYNRFEKFCLIDIIKGKRK